MGTTQRPQGHRQIQPCQRHRPPSLPQALPATVTGQRPLPTSSTARRHKPLGSAGRALSHALIALVVAVVLLPGWQSGGAQGLTPREISQMKKEYVKQALGNMTLKGYYSTFLSFMQASGKGRGGAKA